MSEMRNRIGRYSYHANFVRRGIRGTLAHVQDMRSNKENQGRAKLILQPCFVGHLPSEFRARHPPALEGAKSANST